MGMVFQSYSLFPNMSALAERRLRAAAAQDRRGRAADAAPASCSTWSGWPRRPGQYPHQLSGGQQQRVALARRAGHRAAGAAARRAAVRAGRQGPAAAAEQIRTLQQRLRHHHPVRHPRPGGGAVDGRPGRRDEATASSSRSPRPTSCTRDPATAFVAEFVGAMNRIPGELQAGDQVTALGSTVPVRRTAAPVPDARWTCSSARRACGLEVVENGNGIVTDQDVPRLGDQGRRAAVRRRRCPGGPAEREAAALAGCGRVRSASSLLAQPVLVARPAGSGGQTA